MKIAIGRALTTKKPVAFDLDVLLTTRLLIQANSGAGKSYLLRKLMEEMFGHVQVIAIDPEGEFATLREKFDYVLVGKGGETPAHVSTAEELAHKLLELRASAVCDLYEMPARERHAWTQKFLGALINAPKKLWHPVIIIVDEAHIFCPEKGAGESEASDAMIDLATRGRKRGFCAVFATQRLGKLRKDAAAELQNVMIGGTFLDVDVKRAAETLGIPKGKDEREFAAHMKVVAPGTFIALGRAISKERLELRVGEVQTSHPKPGSAKHAAEPPAPSAKVRELLTKLAELPQIAEEKARTMAELQRKVRELQGQLAQAKRTQPQASAADPAQLREMRSQLAGLQKQYAGAKAAMEEAMKIIARVTAIGFDGLAIKPEELKGALDQAAEQIGKLAKRKIEQRNSDIEAVKKDVRRVQSQLSKLIDSKDSEIIVAVDVKRNEPFTVASHAPRPLRIAAESNGAITAPQMRILGAIACFHALGRSSINKATIAVLAQASSTSSSYSNNLGSLRTAGLIDYPQGGMVSLTKDGLAVAPQVDPPASAQEMLEQCKKMITRPQARILDELAKKYPSPVEKSGLADLVEASAGSSSYSNNLGFLRSAAMIDYPAQGQVKISNWVMLEE
jgi:Helicase HerA, central domain